MIGRYGCGHRGVIVSGTGAAEDQLDDPDEDQIEEEAEEEGDEEMAQWRGEEEG